MSGEFTVTLTVEEVLAAKWLRVRRRWWWKGAAKLIAILGTVYTGMGLAGEWSAGLNVHEVLHQAAIGFGIAAAVMGVLVLYWIWCIPRAVRRMAAEQPLLTSPMVFDFDDTGLRVRNERESSDLLWSHLLNWIENGRLLVISRTRLTFFVIPKAQIEPATLADLRQALIAGGVKQGI